MYTTLKEVTKTAEELNFTVGAFNTHNLEMLPCHARLQQKKWVRRSLFKQVVSINPRQNISRANARMC